MFVGPVTVHVHDEMVFEPDLVFVRSDRRPIVDPEGGIHGAPDLVSEVLSPGTGSYDRNLKRKHYMESRACRSSGWSTSRSAVEVWHADTEEPEVERATLRWEVGGATFALALGEMLAGV